MAEVENEKSRTLSQQYMLDEKVEQPNQGQPPSEATEDEKPIDTVVVEDIAEVTKEVAIVEESNETPSKESNEAATEEINEDATEETNKAAVEQSSEAPEQEESSDPEIVEQTPEIKLETAPADFRFPTTNQTRHCFTRYIEYHRCIAAKGEGAPECDKFAKYYRSLCPGEWVSIFS
uniref:Cytochrome c oxidase subunit 6b-1-like n=1 Tax=Nelumbo nucifera TaxID=4432 RepID=A0A822XKB7_NELNU|nr:TPA_asm: hypothetical protein HUJ06_023477 [Nelumbo nucifera]